MQNNALEKPNNRISTRDSNIELLRIISMIAIVAHHLFYHGGIFQNTGNNIANLLWGGVIIPGGKIGYDCFVIITAWFLSGKQFKGRRFINIALEAIFFNIVGMGLATALNNGIIEPITPRNWIGCFFPISGITHGFAIYYLVFLLLLPLLNYVSEKMSKKNTQAILLLLFLIKIWSPVFRHIVDIANFTDLTDGLYTFVFIYFVIVYIKRWPFKFHIHRAIWVSVFALLWILVSASYILSVAYPEIGVFSLFCSFSAGDSSPVTMLIAFCLFFLFKDIKVKQNKFINFIASHTFGILLFHDHNYFRYIIWERVFSVKKSYEFGFGALVLYTVSVVIIIFLIGTVIDLIREYALEKNIQKTKIYSKICGTLENYFQL